MKMLDQKDYSKYSKRQLYFRMTALVAAIQEKTILTNSVMMLFARLEGLVYQTIQSEIDELLYLTM